jgi:hypothetical protein
MKKRVSIVVLALLLVASFTGFAFAQRAGMDPNEVFMQKMGQAKAMNFSGTVLSHDVACHCMVLKTAKGTLTLQDDYAKFEGEYDKAKGVKVGHKVKGTYKTVDYINYIGDIHLED